MLPFLFFALFCMASTVALTWLSIARGRHFGTLNSITRADYPRQFWFWTIQLFVGGMLAAIFSF
ncbi:MAG: hypothetical protein ACTHJR_07965, partial [Sphingomonas sp.]